MSLSDAGASRSRFARSTEALPPASPLALAIVLAIGLAFAFGVYLKTPGLNGTWYWAWPYRDLGIARVLALLVLPMVPFVLALREIERRQAARSLAWPIALLMLTSFGLQLLGMLCRPEGLEHLRAIVMSPIATSYFTDALKIDDLGTWLANFHTATLAKHSATHPPGPILYYWFWLQLFSAPTAALVGGVALGALATLAIPVLYQFAGLWTDDRRARLVACAYYALVPAIVVFFPEFDQIYPIFAMLAVVAWVRALRGSPAAAIAFGVVLFVETFFAYNLLAAGAFLAMYAAYFLWRERGVASAWRALIVASSIGVAVFGVCNAIAWLCGFDPVRTFVHALAMQKLDAATVIRPWTSTVLLDPYDFLLGAGILAGPLILMHVARIAKSFAAAREEFALSIMALATILVVDVSGLLRGETARLWLFLQPFAIVPASRELLRFDARGRALFFAVQWLIVAVMVCRMTFVEP
ncbi:MAG: hypothetical protein ABW186_11730 [Rhodanobacteraceae bacterium]